MDLATHFLVPFAAALLAGWPRKHRLAFALGGIAPDIEVWLPLSFASPELYFLGHRGVSHTLTIGPFWAMALLFTLTRPATQRRLPRLAGPFAWEPATIALVVSGVVTHLILDSVTITGVPALFPLSDRWFTVNVFFYSSLPLLVASVVILSLRLAGRLDDGRFRVAAVAWIALFVLLGAVQVATMPTSAAYRIDPDPDDGRIDALRQDAYPQQVPGRWAVFTTYENGSIEGRTEGWLADADVHWYGSAPPADDAARTALEASERLPEHRKFRWNAHGPVVVRVEARDDGGHDVTFVSVLERYRGDSSSFGLARRVLDQAGVLRIAVSADGTARAIT